MAAREGQGLQIAVIIFAMLTIILAITTYIFYAQSQTADKARQDAVATATRLQGELTQERFRLKAHQFVLGDSRVTEDMIATDAAASSDKEVADLLANFKTDKAAVGSHLAEGQVANYRTLPTILLAAINRKNASVVDATEEINKTLAEKAAIEARELARNKAADDAVAQANTALAAETNKYKLERDRVNAEKATLTTQANDRDKRYKGEIDTLDKTRTTLESQVVRSTETIKGLLEQRKVLEGERTNLFESPDGKITWVNQRQRLVWIDAGRADGLMRQTTFAVFDHDINGVTNAEPKGRIEVVRLTDEHMAECRILEDSPANPIMPGDMIHTPTWSPGQRLHFALAGFMDIDGDRVDDYELVKNIITLNGGIIDAEVRPDGTRDGALKPDTRYLVLGDPPDDRSSEKALAEFTKIQDEVGQFGTDRITVQKLLVQMGWKAEERTVEMAGGSGGAFRSRKPGQKPTPGAQPAEGAAPAAAEPMPPAEGAPPAADPFAAPAADPFAAPAAPGAPATPAPAPAADPFAPSP
jgi:hypothetical protein